MAQPTTLNAEPRTLGGKSHLTQLRRQGKIPAVLYGHKQDTTPIQMDAKTFDQFLKRHGPGGLVELQFDSERELTMIKEIQHHVVSGQVVHVDLQRVSMEDQIHASVPIILTGDTSAITDNGGVMEQLLTDLSVVCRADHLPEQILVDISGLEVGHSINVGTLSLPEGVEAQQASDAIIVAAHRSAASRGEATAEAAEAVEAAAAAE